MDPVERKKIAVYLENLFGRRISDRRIRTIRVNPKSHAQPKMRIEVGEICANLEPGAPGQLVVAIFESVAFLVCTPKRGAGKDMPYIFTRDDVLQVEEMDDTSC